MARLVAVAALLVLSGGVVAAQDVAQLLTAGSCENIPCAKAVSLPEECCTADYLSTLAQGIGSPLAMLHNDTSVLCSPKCEKHLLGPFKKCLIQEMGGSTVNATLPDDFCGAACLFDDEDLNISSRDIYDCGTLEDIKLECRYNITKNTKVGDLFRAGYRNCEFEEDEYMDNAAGAVASFSLAAIATGAAALVALLA